jgi:type II secretory pathway component PulJ
MRRFDDQRGFTLVELLVSCMLGMIVLLAIFGLVDTTNRTSSRITQRVDASQRGRTAMEQMTQALRSVVCVKEPAATAPGVIQSGDNQQITVYAQLQKAPAGQASPSAPVTERREYRYDAAADTLTETVWAGAGALPDLTFPSTATRRRSVLTNVAEPPGGRVFTYYAYKADGTIDPTPLATPLSVADLARVVRVRVSFVSRPSDGGTVRAVQAPFQNFISMRLPVDPSAPGDGPTCSL